ncbi:MAG: DEAD/DEAH box helicase family protein [Chitinophagaceae bacterium]
MFFLSGFAKVNVQALKPEDIEAIRAELTYTPKVFDRGIKKQEVPEPIYGYRRKGLFYELPLYWAINRWPKAQWKDNRTTGPEMSELANKKIVPRNDKQKAFFDSILRQLYVHGLGFANAEAGSGKTVAGINTISFFGGRALIVVPMTDMIGQWANEITRFLDIPPEDIGIIQQDRCEYHKPVCIASLDSLVQREYPAALYKAFRTVVYDEVSAAGARKRSRVLGMFSARYQLALDATPNRRDGCEGLFLNYFGADFINSEQKVLPCLVKKVDYYFAYKTYVRNSFNNGICASAVATNENRNLFLAMWIRKLHKYANGFGVLGIGDRIEQLELLKIILLQVHGLNAEVFVSKTSDAEKERILAEAPIILATRGMFRMARNVPRLAAGIELTPASAARQELGRIRRTMQGSNKPVPLWITVIEKGIPFFERVALKRLKECRQLPQVTVLDE